MVLTVAASNGTVTVSDVYNGTTKLTATTNYTVNGSKVTLLKTYLATLIAGDYTIKVETDQGDVTAAVKVVDTTPEG